MSAGNGKRTPLVADKRYSKTRSTKAAPARAARKPRRQKPARRRNFLVRIVTGLFGWLFGLVWRIAWRLGLLGGIVLSLVVLYFVATLPQAGALLDGRARGSVTLLDREGQVFAWRGEQFNGEITAENVAPYLKEAIVATEDKRFYRHFGLSPRGIASAVRINLREGRGPLSGHGGSTITQQTAKLLCLGVAYDPKAWPSKAAYEADCREGSILRKAKEAVFALALEVKYSKDEILTIYMNRAYMGGGAQGVEAASQRYFGHSAFNMSVAESAMLAGLLTAPSRFAPTADLKRSQDRAAVVVGLMREQGRITEAEASEALARPAILSQAAQKRAGGFFADWVMGTGPDFLTSDTTEDVIIRTTFDQRMQKAAEDALQYVFENKVKEGSLAQAAIVVMSADGAVRAMVGGRKFQGTAGEFNRAIQAKRQTGSSFKPFVYAAALDLGFTYADTVLDEPLTIDIPGSGPWTPKNYSNEFKGPVTFTDALKHSLNIPAVRISEMVGRDTVRAVAEGFGIESDLAEGPALALGTSESNLLEMTGAYAGILNGGSSVTPYGLTELRLQGDDEPLMDQSGGIGERVISPGAAEQLIYMMHQVVLGGTGTRANLPDREVAGKSGTTQAARDAWFLGFSADYVAGVWMGYDDNTPLSGVTGGTLPAEIWHETMLRVHEGLPANPLPMIRPSAPPVAQLGLDGEPQTRGQGRGGRRNNNRDNNGGNSTDRAIIGILEAIFGNPNR